MPTSEEWEGMGRKVDMKLETIGPSKAYNEGYDDGLSEGERRGWEMGKEAAAEKAHIEWQLFEQSRKETQEPNDKEEHDMALGGCVAARSIEENIRKLKKP